MSKTEDILSNLDPHNVQNVAAGREESFLGDKNRPEPDKA